MTDKLRSLRKQLIVVSILGLLASLFGLYSDRERFFAAYLVAYMLCLGLTLGPLAVSLTHNLTGGRWGEAIKGVNGSGVSLLPILALLFLPILFGFSYLYPWTRNPPNYLPHEFSHALAEKVAEKSWYLNSGGYLVRSVLCFVIWGFYGLLTRGVIELKAVRGISGLGLVLYTLTLTSAATDWLMSISPLFYSTIYGFIVLTGQLTSAFALTILALAVGAVACPASALADISHDLGNFLLMSIMLWAYTSYSQLLLIWSGQKPEEILWYNQRFVNEGLWLGPVLLCLHFFLPFFLLLSRRRKRSVRSLAKVALLLLFARWVELVWLVQPNFSEGTLALPWQMLVVPLTLLSFWLVLFLAALERAHYGRNPSGNQT